MTSDKRLQEIEARLKAAAPGPWKMLRDGCYGEVESATGRHLCTAGRRDAALIAHAPSDLAYCTERLRKYIERFGELPNE